MTLTFRMTELDQPLGAASADAATPPQKSAEELAAAKAATRRIVPDLSDQIEVGGQRLVKAVRKKKPSLTEPATEGDEPEKKITIDDIAKRHLDPEHVRLIEENSEIFRALSEVDEPLVETPPIAEIASRVELFQEGEDIVPPAEPDPKKRSGMSMSPIVGTSDMPDEILFGKGAPSTLWDLFERFPQLDGINWRIHVERKTPKQFGGVPCAGMLQPITQPITLDEWANYYGGGTYKLIVYGPPKKSGPLDASGRVQPKRLTEPIEVVFPGAPSLESMVYEGEEESMTQGMPGLHGRRGPATLGDGRIEEIKTNAELTREQRQAEERDKAEAAKEKLRQQAESAKGDVAAQMIALTRQMNEQNNAFRREQADREAQHQREMREERDRFEEKLEALKSQKPERDPFDMLVALKGLSGGDEGKAMESMRRDHQKEIERMVAIQKEDMERHQRLLADERTRCDRLIDEEKRRIEQRTKDLEHSFAEKEREYRQRADQEIQKAKDEAERRLNDLHRQHQESIANEARNHDRDLKSQQAMHQMTLDSLKASHGMQLDGTKAEVKRTEIELERARSEAEKNKDPLVGIKRIKAQAEALGMSEGGAEEPPTTAQTILGMLAGLASNAPAMVEQFAGMGKARTEQQIEVARQQARAEMIAGAAPAFQQPPQLTANNPSGGRQRRDGFRPMGSGSRAPLIPGQEPLAVRRQQTEQSLARRPGQADLEPEVAIDYAPPMDPNFQPVMPGEPPMPSGMPPEPQLHPTSLLAPQSMAPAPMPQSFPPPPPAPNEAALRAEDAQIVGSLGPVQQQYQSGMPAEEVARQIVQQFGPDMARGIVQQLGSADRVIEAIERAGDPDSPFLLRDGKKFLRNLFAAIS